MENVLAVEFPLLSPIKEYVEDVKIVSKEWAEKRKKEKIPLWTGYCETIPTKDYKYIVVTLYNKYDNKFRERFMYENNLK